jgi:flagellar motor protein MotB
MNKPKKDSFFWISYSDLMTSLFFVMLVLFILVIAVLHSKIKATQAELDKIREIQESVRSIDQNYFEYDEDFKRHTLRDIQVSFNVGSSNISDIPQSQRNRLLSAGRSIQNFVNEAVSNNPGVKYLLIVEGQASRDPYYRNFELSYERALTLVNFWQANGVDFFRNENIEIIISGSGTASPFRVQPDIRGNRANQRFVIHIIPKIGEIETITR